MVSGITSRPIGPAATPAQVTVAILPVRLVTGAPVVASAR